MSVHMGAEEKYVELDEAAKLLRKPTSWVLEQIWANKLQTGVEEGRWGVRADDLRQYVERFAPLREDQKDVDKIDVRLKRLAGELIVRLTKDPRKLEILWSLERGGLQIKDKQVKSKWQELAHECQQIRKQYILMGRKDRYAQVLRSVHGWKTREPRTPISRNRAKRYGKIRSPRNSGELSQQTSYDTPTLQEQNAAYFEKFKQVKKQNGSWLPEKSSDNREKRYWWDEED